MTKGALRVTIVPHVGNQSSLESVRRLNDGIFQKIELTEYLRHLRSDLKSWPRVLG